MISDLLPVAHTKTTPNNVDKLPKLPLVYVFQIVRYAVD